MENACISYTRHPFYSHTKLGADKNAYYAPALLRTQEDKVKIGNLICRVVEMDKEKQKQV